ncbi:MAG: AAA family ATPase [Microcystaceae cyanobacterium]
MLKNLKLNGYKSIRSLDIELNKVNVLIGANGSGKSNFISFFRLLNSMFKRHIGRQWLTDYLLRDKLRNKLSK